MRLVEIDLVPGGKGTLLRLTNRGLDREGRECHEASWNYKFKRFVLAFDGPYPGHAPKQVGPSYRRHAGS